MWVRFNYHVIVHKDHKFVPDVVHNDHKLVPHVVHNDHKLVPHVVHKLETENRNELLGTNHEINIIVLTIGFTGLGWYLF